MKNLKISILVFAIMLLFTACSDKAQPDSSPAIASAAQSIKEAPDRPSEIYGKVNTIIGNEVTIALAEPPNTAEITDAEKEKRKAEMQALSPEERQKLRNEQLKFTGETMSVIIPVGMPITAGSTVNEVVNLKEVALTDIYEGTFLRIWLEKGGSGEEKTAEYVRVLQSQQ